MCTALKDTLKFTCTLNERSQKISIPVMQTAFWNSKGKRGSSGWNSKGMVGIYRVVAKCWLPAKFEKDVIAE